MLMLEPATAVRYPAGKLGLSCRRLSHSNHSFFVPWDKFRSLTEGSCVKRNIFVKSRVRACAKEQSGSIKKIAKPQRYHPSEDISNSESDENGEAILRPAETSRTIIEVNSKAMLMFSGLLSDEVHENIFCPDLPYVTDEHGTIYFQVKNDEDILQTLASEENLVQIIIGLETAEILSEMESLSDFGIEEIDDEDSDVDYDDSDDEEEDGDEDDEDDNYEKDFIAILDDEEDGEDGEDEEDSDGSLGDWAKLETMRSSHPMHFATQLAELVSDDPINYMEQPPAGIAIQGLLRPALVEEHFIINKHLFDHRSSNTEARQVGEVAEEKEDHLGIINGHRHELGPSQDGPILDDGSQKDQSLGVGTSYYMLEMTKIQLISAHGNETSVEVEDFRRAQPDAIAHSAAKIISRLKVGGEKTMHALKSLCWRCKGIQVEEVALIGIDSLGFDLRVCAGSQLQTLRFAFDKQASSEYSAERQLNDLLFPRIHGKQQKKKEAHQSEL